MLIACCEPTHKFLMKLFWRFCQSKITHFWWNVGLLKLLKKYRALCKAGVCLLWPFSAFCPSVCLSVRLSDALVCQNSQTCHIKLRVPFCALMMLVGLHPSSKKFHFWALCPTWSNFGKRPLKQKQKL